MTQTCFLVMYLQLLSQASCFLSYTHTQGRGISHDDQNGQMIGGQLTQEAGIITAVQQKRCALWQAYVLLWHMTK